MHSVINLGKCLLSSASFPYRIILYFLRICFKVTAGRLQSDGTNVYSTVGNSSLDSFKYSPNCSKYTALYLFLKSLLRHYLLTLTASQAVSEIPPYKRYAPITIAVLPWPAWQCTNILFFNQLPPSNTTLCIICTILIVVSWVGIYKSFQQVLQYQT